MYILLEYSVASFIVHGGINAKNHYLTCKSCQFKTCCGYHVYDIVPGPGSYKH